MATSRRINGHKFTAFCPIKGCKYTSKIPYVIKESLAIFGGLNNTNSVHSKTCPKHRILLVVKN
jgi:hypothetical protein